MTPEDQEDYTRLKNTLDRLGKAVLMSADTEMAEIIRRRLFEWEGLPSDANATIRDKRRHVPRLQLRHHVDVEARAGHPVRRTRHGPADEMADAQLLQHGEHRLDRRQQVGPVHGGASSFSLAQTASASSGP